MKDFAEYKNTLAVPENFVRRESVKAEKGLNVLVACAGSGKTSFLAQLASGRESVCVSLGPGDNSADGIISVLTDILFRAGKPAEYDTPNGLIGAAVTYLAEKDIIFIADNADKITDREAAGLLALLSGASARGAFTAVFAGRKPPLCVLAYLMDGSAHIISPEVLYFTREQVAGLMKSFGAEDSDLLVSEVLSYTDGWCIGVTQILRNMRKGEPLSRACARSYLGEYVKENIIGELDEPLSEYLILSSLFDAPDEDIAREVLMIRDAGERICSLVKYGILRNEEGPSLPLVMKNIFAGLVPEKRRRELTERAADRYIAEKRFAEAVKLFEANGDVKAAERILSSYGERMLQNGEFELVGYCGNIITANGLPSDPKILGTLAQYYYYCGDLEKMEAAYNMADSRFGRENEYSVYRKFYNGLIRYEKNTKLYSGNVLSALDYLNSHSLPLPFLYQKELDVLARIKGEGSDTGDRLVINRFGGFSVKAGGTELQCGSKKGAELVAYMLENRNKPIPREEILEMLWPQGIPNNAVAMLHNIIYGLRKELAAFELENIIIYKNKCYILDMSRITEDDRPILEVCAAVDSKDTSAILKHESVLSAYWGKYLGNIDSRWTDMGREYYDKCYIEAVMTAAENYREKNDRQKELAMLKNALALDPYSERIMHDILLCYFALGKPDKAKKTYEEYSELIDEEFGIRPSKWLKNEFFSCFSSD